MITIYKKMPTTWLKCRELGFFLNQIVSTKRLCGNTSTDS